MIVGFDDYKSKYSFNVNGIIHVGAHLGQEYEEYINFFGNVKIHFFEPLPEMFLGMQKNLGDKSDVYLHNVALGECDSLKKMYVDTEMLGQCSSVLKPKEFFNIFSHIKFDEKNEITVQQKTLDSYSIDDCNMLTLDVQGYELMVLKGSVKTLEKIDYIFTEFNTVEMYESCPSLEELDSFLYQRNFIRVETWYTDGNWGDAFYLKQNKSF